MAGEEILHDSIGPVLGLHNGEVGGGTPHILALAGYFVGPVPHNLDLLLRILEVHADPEVPVLVRQVLHIQQQHRIVVRVIVVRDLPILVRVEPLSHFVGGCVEHSFHAQHEFHAFRLGVGARVVDVVGAGEHHVPGDERANPIVDFVVRVRYHDQPD